MGLCFRRELNDKKLNHFDAIEANPVMTDMGQIRAGGSNSPGMSVTRVGSGGEMARTAEGR